MNTKYNNSLYTLDVPEVETRIDEFEDLITNYEPTSIIKDDYNAFQIYEMTPDKMLEWVEDMVEKCGGE